jgi:hypothetical protein
MSREPRLRRNCATSSWTPAATSLTTGLTDPRVATDQDCRGRIQGALHSWLSLIDGVVGGMHGFDLVAVPHPDDKEFCRGEGKNWSEPGTVINEQDMLNDLLYGRGAWAPGGLRGQGQRDGEVQPGR